MTHVLINAENFLTKVYKVQVIGTTMFIVLCLFLLLFLASQKCQSQVHFIVVYVHDILFLAVNSYCNNGCVRVLTIEAVRFPKKGYKIRKTFGQINLIKGNLIDFCEPSIIGPKSITSPLLSIYTIMEIYSSLFVAFLRPEKCFDKKPEEQGDCREETRRAY